MKLFLGLIVNQTTTAQLLWAPVVEVMRFLCSISVTNHWIIMEHILRVTHMLQHLFTQSEINGDLSSTFYCNIKLIWKE